MLREKLNAWWDKAKAYARGCVKSWTIWFNSAWVLLLAWLPDIVMLIQTELPAVQAYIPAELYKWLNATGIIGNLLLRFKTTKALPDK